MSDGNNAAAAKRPVKKKQIVCGGERSGVERTHDHHRRKYDETTDPMRAGLHRHH